MFDGLSLSDESLYMKQTSSIALTNGKSQATFTDIHPCTYELCIRNLTVH